MARTDRDEMLRYRRECQRLQEELERVKARRVIGVTFERHQAEVQKAAQSADKELGLAHEQMGALRRLSERLARQRDNAIRHAARYRARALALSEALPEARKDRKELEAVRSYLAQERARHAGIESKLRADNAALRARVAELESIIRVSADGHQD